MTELANIAVSSSLGGPRTVRRAIASRLRGPGGFYNVGNLLGLVTGLSVQFADVAARGTTSTESILAYFVGGPSALALTIATLIFLVSGEAYHRAWGLDGLNTDLNRLADLLSAFGAAALAVSLVYLNQPILAVLTGFLIVGGKLGSAVNGDLPGMSDLWPCEWPDLFRLMALAGRIPGVAAAGLVLWHQAGVSTPLSEMVQPAVMVLCHLLWIRADTLLFRGKSAA